MGYCMSKECVEEYLGRLGEGLAEYMKMPVSTRSTEAVAAMVECYERTKGLLALMEDKEEFTYDDAMSWSEHMMNADGTKGGHWSIAETNTLPKPETCSDYSWNAVMNMMYSDYCEVAMKYGVNTAEFYADMAKAFVHDPDAGKNKLAKYYNYIAR